MDLYKMLRSAGKSTGIRNDYMLWMEKSSHTATRWSGIDGSVSPLGNMLYTFATADALSSLSDVHYRFEGRV